MRTLPEEPTRDHHHATPTPPARRAHRRVRGVQLRALSIRQPWLWLLMHGYKPVENRRWARDYRGSLVLHASQRIDPEGFRRAAQLGIAVPEQLPTGCYVAVVDLLDQHPDGGCCRPWGDPDTVHWEMTPLLVFPEPVPGRGRLGLYRPPEYLAQPLRAALTLRQRRQSGLTASRGA